MKKTKYGASIERINFTVKRGFNVLALEYTSSPTPTRIRRKTKKRYSVVKYPFQHYHHQFVTTEKQKEPCTPYTVHKTVVTSEGEIQPVDADKRLSKVIETITVAE